VDEDDINPDEMPYFCVSIPAAIIWCLMVVAVQFEVFDYLTIGEILFKAVNEANLFFQ